jgi:hypothetical protein
MRDVTRREASTRVLRCQHSVRHGSMTTNGRGIGFTSPAEKICTILSVTAIMTFAIRGEAPHELLDFDGSIPPDLGVKAMFVFVPRMEKRGGEMHY